MSKDRYYDIKTLSELVEYGIDGACEDDRYYYIYADRPNRDIYDSSFFRYDKKTKELKWFTSALQFPEVFYGNAARPVEDLSIFEKIV